MRLAFVFAVVGHAAFAGVPEAVNDHILPKLSEFQNTAANLAAKAGRSCTRETLVPAYHAAFDSWAQIGDLRIGPNEAGALSIAFWPDKKGFTPKALSRLILDEDVRIDSGDDFKELSIAARGFFALERMLFDPKFNMFEETDYACRLVQRLSTDLAEQATDLRTAWQANFAEKLLLTGNTAYLDETEATRAIYTQVLTSLENTIDLRLGRPLGEVTRPRPQRAEAWRSERSLKNVMLSTQGAVDLASALSNWDLPRTNAAMAHVHDQAARITDLGFQDIEDLTARFNLEVLAQRINAVKTAIEFEVGQKYGITPGFNSSDGD